jgi:hypothetical protein
MGRLLAIATAFLTLGAGTAQAATYYVSASGSDANAGRSVGAAWRTVGRVNAAALKPGDHVLFEAHRTFSDTTLMPSRSGTAARRISFGSYGRGRATIANPAGAVWIPDGRSYLTFENLELSTGRSAVSIFAGAATGTGNTAITLRHSTLTKTGGSAIVSKQRSDAGWRILGNTIAQTGDSAMILLGAGALVAQNTIAGVGWNSSIAWGKHGIYAKGPRITIDRNDISGVPHGQAVSLRFHGARVFGNTIHDTPFAIAFFDYDTAAAPQGTGYIYNNRLWNISGWGFYYDGQLDPNGHAPSVDFVLASNTFSFSGASEAVNVSPSGSARVTLANNAFMGSYTSGLRAARTTREYHNGWAGGRLNLPRGAGDIYSVGGVSSAPMLAPQHSSALVDGGSRRVSGIRYHHACDGRLLHFCGSAPDIGAGEFTFGSHKR